MGKLPDYKCVCGHNKTDHRMGYQNCLHLVGRGIMLKGVNVKPYCKCSQYNDKQEIKGGNKWGYGSIHKFLTEMLRRERIGYKTYLSKNEGKEIDCQGEDVKWQNQNYESKIWCIESLFSQLDYEYEKETGHKIHR